MNRIPDELVMAYVDGALSGEQAAAVEGLLRVCCQTRRLAIIFRATALCAREAFAPLEFAKLPQRLTTLVSPAERQSPPSMVRSVLAALCLGSVAGMVLAIGTGLAISLETRKAPGFAEIKMNHEEISPPSQRKFSALPLVVLENYSAVVPLEARSLP